MASGLSYNRTASWTQRQLRQLTSVKRRRTDVVVSMLAVAKPKGKAVGAEKRVLEALQSAKGRGKTGLSDQQVEQLNSAVDLLETDGGLKGPTASPVINGKWRLLYTSRPGTSSPIQRTFTGIESFSVFQEVELEGEIARVTNIVDFGPSIGYLRVEAEASTDSRPLEGFTPRAGEGLALFGKSFVYPPARPDMRIDFQFDQAAFYFRNLPFTIPYPVPFRLLGDETKGWIDTTYMNADGTFRLARGNKGTLFILVKEVPAQELLLRAISEQDDERVMQLVTKLEQQSPVAKPAFSTSTNGRWRLVWSQQAPNASALQKWGSQQANSFQIIEGSKAQNLVDLGIFKIVADATCEASGPARTNVNIGVAELKVGPLTIPLKSFRGQGGYIDWLYLDESLRVTRGNKGSLFVHVRDQ